MYFAPPTPFRRRMWCTTGSILAALLFQGCQSYKPAPLDIAGFGTSFDSRLINPEPVTDFARRLHDAGENVPTHFDPADGITYAEGEVLALFYNPDLRIARLEAGVSLATRDNAGLWDDPVFGFDGAEIISPSSPFEYGLMFNLTIPISGRLEVEKERANAAYETQLRVVADAEWRTRAKLRKQWAIWTAAVEQFNLLTKTIEQLQEINSIADDLETAGELNRIERRLLRIELANRTVQATEMRLQVLKSEVALLEVLGLSLEASELLIPAFPETNPPVITDATDRLIKANTELAVHFAEYKTAEETLRLEIREQFPDISVGTGYGTEFNDKRVMFGVSIPIPILNANRAAIAEASARREVARAAAETTFVRLQRNLSGAYAELDVKREQRDQYVNQVVPLLTAQTEDIKKIAELGELDMFVLLETVTRTLDAKQRLIELRSSELDAAITVRQILGPNSDENPSPKTLGTDVNDPSMPSTGVIVAGGTK